MNGFLVIARNRLPIIIESQENVIALGPSGPGRTHVALGLGLAAWQKGMPVSFVTAASLVHEVMEARDEARLLRLQRQLDKVKLLIVDELGFVPLSKTGAELLFGLISQRYEIGSTVITSNLSFEEWTETFGTERLTDALLDRLTHHVNILEMNGKCYRLNQSKSRRAKNRLTFAPPQWQVLALPLTQIARRNCSVIAECVPRKAICNVVGALEKDRFQHIRFWRICDQSNVS